MAVSRLGLGGVCDRDSNEIATDVDALSWTGKGQLADPARGKLTVEGKEL